MACLFEVIFPARERSKMGVVQRALDEVERLEQQMSVYRPDSEISSINRKAATSPQKVESRLLDLLGLACRISCNTHGSFDITSGPLSKCWGFSDRQGRLPSGEELDDALARVGYQHLRIDEQEGTIFFDRPLELNLGGIGKGYALDRAAEVLREGDLKDTLLHGGNSSILASGDSPACPGMGWPVAIADPDGEAGLGTCYLKDLALSCSGVAQQNFQSGDRRFGHIIDPRSGSPAETHRSATALAPAAAMADALSTAFFMMPLDQVEDFCRKNQGIGALIVPSADPAETGTIHRLGVAEQLYWIT